MLLPKWLSPAIAFSRQFLYADTNWRSLRLFPRAPDRSFLRVQQRHPRHRRSYAPGRNAQAR
jgi:hypothetical protein